MGNKPGNTQIKFSVIYKVGSFAVKILVQTSHMQINLFKLLDLQTKHLLKLAILESGKKKNPLPQRGKFTEQKHLCVYGRGKKCIPTPNLLTSY